MPCGTLALIGRLIADTGMKNTTESIVRKILIGLACTVSGIGVYLCYWWPEEWQAGLVFVLFGMIVIIPGTINEIRFRKTIKAGFPR
jgi:hypothetical protein